MPLKYLAVVMLWSFVGSSCSYKLTRYLKPTNHEIVYNCTFVKSKDNYYKNLESIFGSVSKGDTISEKIVLSYKTIRIDGKIAYYVIDTSDIIKKDASIGPKHFLSSAMIFSEDSVLLASVYKKSDLLKLNSKDFDYAIHSVKKKDTLRFADKSLPQADRQILLYNFRKEKISINDKKIRNCLYISVAERWPDATYFGKVWLHKKYGVVKWIRVTGRIEEIEL